MEPIVKGKAVKRKKPPAEFTADNIDNTAPVKKILDDLQHKNSQAFMFYGQTLRQRRTLKDAHHNYHFAVPGHPLNAFTDDWDGGLNSGYFETFTYKSLPPTIVTEMKNLDKVDPVATQMKLKREWTRDCRNLRLSVAQGNMMQKYEKLNEEVVYCPKHFVDMAAHLDSDPDPYFDSSYNWYYAGNGNLQIICVDWVDYLLHSEFDTMYLTVFSKNEPRINTPVATFSCGEDNNILETICSSQNIVALRTKHKIFILKLHSSSDEITVENIKVIESELPFTSISFDKHHKNILYIVALNCKLTIVNLDRLTGRTVRLKSNVTSFVNNWNCVISSDRTSYTHVTRNSIAIYDKKNNSMVKMWKGLRDITDEVGCNDISAATQPEGKSSVYFATDHHMFLMDIRFVKNFKPIQRWTHGMQCMPTYMSTCHFEFNKELVCLSSQWCEDTCVIPNYTDHLTKDTELRAVLIPYRPPNILNSLHEARQQALCLDLYNPIDGRLSTAITGHVIMEQGEKYLILVQNSLGDIFSQVLYPEYMETFIDDDSAQRLHEWCKAFKITNKEYEITSMGEISDTWKCLKKVPDYYDFVDKNSPKRKFDENEIQKSFENDELDSGLLDIWTKASNESIAETTVEQSSLALNLHYSDSE